MSPRKAQSPAAKGQTPSAQGPSLIVYQGAVNSWECDENRHLNVRFFNQRAWDGIIFLASHLRMPSAFKPGATSTLLLDDIHVRFLREAHEENPLTMRAGVLDVSDMRATIYEEMHHADGGPAAAFIVAVSHVDATTGARFPWSARTRAALEELRCTPPEHGRPRSVDNARPPSGEASIARADALGVPLIGRGVVAPQECDVFGRMRPEWFFGRVSDSVPHLRRLWRVEPEPDGDIGGVVLEYRIAVRAWPRAGDLYEVRSAMIEIGEKTRRLVHWILDPESGTAWASAEAVVVSFDRTIRKAVATPPAHRAILETRTIPAMKM